jgi:hypothetical protein
MPARANAEKAVCVIGGLGMGYTLRAAMDFLPRDAHVAVVELVPGCRGIGIRDVWDRWRIIPLKTNGFTSK